MAINLVKGQKIAVENVKITVGLGWEENKSQGEEFDLDVSAFFLNSNKKLPSESHFVCYAQEKPCKGVKYSGDSRDGKKSNGGDDEQIIIDTSLIDDEVSEILFTVTIYDAVARKQNFGQVRSSYIRILSTETGVVECKFELDEDFSIETAVEFGRLYKKDGKWKFDAIGNGSTKTLTQYLETYL